MDSEILDQLTDLGRDVDSEFPKPKRGCKKKADSKMNEFEDNDVRDKRERLVACVLSGNSKMYLGKEYTEEQINKMDCNDVNTLLNRYESILSAQMTKSLGKSVINLYSNIACSVLGVGNQQELSTDLECDPFLNTAMQRFTCDLYYWFGTLCAPISKNISYNYMSIYIGNDLEDRLEALETENASLRKYNEYHQVVHEIDHMSDLHVDSSFHKQSMKLDNYVKIEEWLDSSLGETTVIQ